MNSFVHERYDDLGKDPAGAGVHNIIIVIMIHSHRSSHVDTNLTHTLPYPIIQWLALAKATYTVHGTPLFPSNKAKYYLLE